MTTSPTSVCIWRRVRDDGRGAGSPSASWTRARSAVPASTLCRAWPGSCSVMCTRRSGQRVDSRRMVGASSPRIAVEKATTRSTPRGAPSDTDWAASAQRSSAWNTSGAEFDDGLPGRSEHDPASRRREHGHTDLAFEPFDLLRHRRGREPELIGRPRQRPESSHRPQRPQGPDIDHEDRLRNIGKKASLDHTYRAGQDRTMTDSQPSADLPAKPRLPGRMRSCSSALTTPSRLRPGWWPIAWRWPTPPDYP